MDNAEIDWFSQSLKSFANDYLNSCLFGHQDIHYAFVGHIRMLFQKKGYWVELEVPIKHPSIRRKTNVHFQHNGFIDLVATKSGRTVAIEFDNGFRLKRKSVEKLLYYRADDSFGVVRGRIDSSSSGATARIRENPERIMQIAEQHQMILENFFFVVLTPWTIQKIF